MSAPVLFNLLNQMGKRDKMRGLPSILSLFCNKFNKFNNAGADENRETFEKAEYIEDLT